MNLNDSISTINSNIVPSKTINPNDILAPITVTSTNKFASLGTSGTSKLKDGSVWQSRVNNRAPDLHSIMDGDITLAQIKETKEENDGDSDQEYENDEEKEYGNGQKEKGSYINFARNNMNGRNRNVRNRNTINVASKQGNNVKLEVGFEGFQKSKID
eukprot:CAMPEP_0116924262 /NCGR_PEP_ID=MMETSP0467-20121206/23393_1 /TAXON_ID=283647 /ORGANISM="Mesodinium pulex, Strain SPMC105" /LENGTH=157 /DNA_ID=CAMNT_0004603031 /DNA_START=313 /DNA_END=786 /DNA_ORIENTATION=+